MFTSGFFNSLNGDRKYDAEQMSSLFDGIISDGVFANVGEQFAVVPGSGMNIIVKTGRAWFNHTWSLNDTWMTLTIDTPDPLRSRIDSVVLEVDHDPLIRGNSIKIVKGSPASMPLPPIMQHTDFVNQYRLANIIVDKDIETITASHVQNIVGMSETPFVTAPIQSVDIDILFQQWDGKFQGWFENIKDQLSGDIAANLQKQVEERVKLIDKATQEDLDNGVPDKWVDTALVNKAISGGITSNLKIGDIVYSIRDLETEAGGMIKCDQRTLSVDEYPELCATDRIKRRIDYKLKNFVIAPSGGSSTYITLKGARIDAIIGNETYNGYLYTISHNQVYESSKWKHTIYVERILINNILNNIRETESVVSDYVYTYSGALSFYLTMLGDGHAILPLPGSTNYLDIDLIAKTYSIRNSSITDTMYYFTLCTDAYYRAVYFANSKIPYEIYEKKMMPDHSAITYSQLYQTYQNGEYTNNNYYSVLINNFVNSRLVPNDAPSIYNGLWVAAIIVYSSSSISSTTPVDSLHLLLFNESNFSNVINFKISANILGFNKMKNTYPNGISNLTSNYNIIVNEKYIFIIIGSDTEYTIMDISNLEHLVVVLDKYNYSYIKTLYFNLNDNNYDPFGNITYINTKHTIIQSRGKYKYGTSWQYGYYEIELDENFSVKRLWPSDGYISEGIGVNRNVYLNDNILTDDVKDFLPFAYQQNNGNSYLSELIPSTTVNGGILIDAETDTVLPCITSEYYQSTERYTGKYYMWRLNEKYYLLKVTMSYLTNDPMYTYYVIDADKRKCLYIPNAYIKAKN